MNLIVDIGNSRVKISIFNGDVIVKQDSLVNPTKESISKFCSGFSIQNAIISSVSEDVLQIIESVSSLCVNCILLDENTALPIDNIYKNPKTLGRDRIAAAVGANEIFPNQNVLIIDAGTAITIDIVTDKNQYLGGNISPGLNTRFKSLHNYTNKLPLLESKNTWSIVGNDTESAIIAGVQQGVIFEIEGYISYFKTLYETISVLITGGDAECIAKHLNHNVIVEPYLVLKGLNRIVLYNANN